MTSIGKETEAVKAYLIKNSKGEGGEGGKRKKHCGWGLVRRQSEGIGGVVWVYKIGLK